MLAPPELPDVSPTAFLILLALGFLVATAGHLYKSKAAIILGMILIVVAVIILPLITLARMGGG